MRPRRTASRYFVGQLVRPSFDNESVYLFPRDPALTLAVGDVIGQFGPPWPRESTGIVLETRDDGWLRLLVPAGHCGWIGDWNVRLVE